MEKQPQPMITATKTVERGQEVTILDFGGGAVVKILGHAIPTDPKEIEVLRKEALREAGRLPPDTLRQLKHTK